MFTETLRQNPDGVRLVCEGKLSQDDLKQMHALLHKRLAASPRPGLVVHLEDFSGYENLSAVKEDLKMDIAHRNDFSRIAVVGNRDWMKWGTKLAGLLTAAEMKWFDAADANRAVRWARGNN